MKAIIVAGGRGERLRPLTDTIPKPMIEVAGKPILEHTIALFKEHDIFDFIFSVCYLPHVITDYFGNGEKFGVHIEYIYENENHPLGSAGNISLAKHNINETFIVTYADILRHIDITDMLQFHIQKHALATINIYKRFGEHPKSMIWFDKNKRITSFIERPEVQIKSNEFVWANGSFYIFEPEIFKFLPNNTYKDFAKDIFPELLKQEKDVFGYQTNEYFIDIGNEEKLQRAKNTYIP